LVNPALISGLADPVSIALSGSDLFVVNQAGSVGEYTTAGATVNAALITGLNGPVGIAIGGTPTVPEPSTWAMMLLGFAGLGYAGYRRARAARRLKSAKKAPRERGARRRGREARLGLGGEN
jgi:threonine/homoserine/homoserine lactone efflux protein